MIVATHTKHLVCRETGVAEGTVHVGTIWRMKIDEGERMPNLSPGMKMVQHVYGTRSSRRLDGLADGLEWQLFGLGSKAIIGPLSVFGRDNVPNLEWQTFLRRPKWLSRTKNCYGLIRSTVVVPRARRHGPANIGPSCAIQVLDGIMNSQQFTPLSWIGMILAIEAIAILLFIRRTSVPSSGSNPDFRCGPGNNGPDWENTRIIGEYSPVQEDGHKEYERINQNETTTATMMIQ
ncbi:hypothetical protein FISHEDRAFT_56275 [Fistulina hepatica ATCC 64428]|uniref:Uncharacterized protein n=1 Tax=Fistulina hepatica ATCC 64428 TaxID=1128425 RepID=A0A0D7AMN0_9AGAR|nr:hypothetical protein FISHEDRAFT_56275 [Fistulina hepatica ATCC 64428]